MNQFQLKKTLIFGEVLIDRFDTGKQNIAGAPFNIAYHLSRFGCEPIFISSVGNDTDGKNIVSTMKKNNMDTSFITVDESKPTGTVQVVAVNEEPQFIIPEEQAYDYIDSRRITEKLQHKPVDLIYHGSLALRNKNNLNLLEKIIFSKKTKLFFDVNLRYPWWNKYVLEKFLRYANFVKMNFWELNIVIDEFSIRGNDIYQAAKKLKNLFTIDFLYVTKGIQGGFLLENNNLIHYDAYKTDRFKNSVGAGDAFCAVIIFGLINKWKLSDTLTAAAEFSSYICSRNSAVTDNYRIYSDLSKKWSKKF